MSKQVENSDHDNVQLITFRGRDPLASLERANKKNNSWQSSPLNNNDSRSANMSSERERFLPPVKLDPGWETVANGGMETEGDLEHVIQEMENTSPKDRFNIIYFVMMIHGVAILIPWNMFINAKSYFEDYKLSPEGKVHSKNLVDYRENFMSYIGMASQYPNFIMNLFNIFVQCGGNTLGIRVLSSISITVAMFVCTVILAMIDTSDWPETFFWLTMGISIVINAACGIYQNSMYGLAAALPMKYTNAIIFGNNVSGTLVALTNIIVLILAPSQRTSAIYYFVVAIVILLVAFDAYFVTGHSAFYRHYTKLAELKEKDAKNKLGSEGSKPFYVLLFKSFGRVFKEIYHLMFAVWFVFFVTLALFPAVMSDVQPVSVNMNTKLWSGIFCFLFFNLFATLGNLTTELVRWPNARWLNVLVILRVAFVPLMVLGNFRPCSRSCPMYVDNDIIFIASAVLFSFSSGYCSSLAMMYAPKKVSPGDAPIAGMVMALMLVFGILCGVNFSRVWTILVNICEPSDLPAFCLNTTTTAMSNTTSL